MESNDNSKPLILVIEDNPDLRRSVCQHLEHAGMVPQGFDRGSKAIEFMANRYVNLVLLDINLPDFNGFDLIREIRASETPPPVIFMTGLNNELSKVRGFENGADDYVTKPFSNAELIARIKAVLRRSETAYDARIAANTKIGDDPFTFCDARVNPARLEIEYPNGHVESIGRKEIGVLSILVHNVNQIISRRTMIHAVWGPHADVKSRSLDQYVVKIRERFKLQNCSTDSFRTIHGVGYIYDR